MKIKEDKNLDGGKLTDYPNDQYRKFFEKFTEIETLEVKDWKPTHILAYFCKKYKETYNKDYKFKFNTSAPSKCFEVFQIKKLASILSSKPDFLKSYIDWVFENKVIKAKRKLSSISFITVEAIVNEYKTVFLSVQNNNSIDRSTPLPESYKSILSQANLNLNTYGELAFVYQMSDMPFEIVGALQRLEEIGFDKEIATRIV